MTAEDISGGPLDVATLNLLARRANAHPLVDSWAYHPDSISPRRLELAIDVNQYPESITDSRLDVRWFEGGDYTFQYVEAHENTEWCCRWDRHPKPDEPRAHFHPPPDASATVEASGLETTHHLGVLFAVIEWVETRVKRLHDDR